MTTPFPNHARIEDMPDRMVAWRDEASRKVAFALMVFSIPPAIALYQGGPFGLPMPVLGVLGAMYLSLVAIAVLPGFDVRIRSTAIVANVVILGVIQLVTTQLTGSGRLTLFAAPLIALVLIGPGSGGLLIAGNTALLIAIPLLIGLGILPTLVPMPLPPSLSLWGLQVITWLAGLLTVFILLDSFHDLQRRTVEAERIARQHLAREIDDRRRLESEISRLSDSERRRLGAELHDGLCQHLTAMLLTCSAFEANPQSAGGKGEADFVKLRESVEDAIGMAYEIARGLCPVDVAPDSLVPALERMCREIRDRHGITCSLDAASDLVVEAPEQAMHLFRIVGEAVTNAVRHAHCTEVRIELIRSDRDILLCVRDNGIGMSPETDLTKGLGLRIMAYRAELLGGTLTTGARGGKGWSITCRIPVQDPLLPTSETNLVAAVPRTSGPGTA